MILPYALRCWYMAALSKGRAPKAPEEQLSCATEEDYGRYAHTTVQLNDLPPFYCDIKLNFSKCASVSGYSRSTKKQNDDIYQWRLMEKHYILRAPDCWSYKRNKRQSSHHCSLINIFRLCASDVIASVLSKLNVTRRKMWASLCHEKPCVPKIALQEQGKP